MMVRDLSTRIRKLGRQIAKFQPPIDRKTAQKLGRLLANELSPPAIGGRRTTPEVARAAELRRTGKAWHRIYPEVIPGFWSKSYPDRYYLSTKLRGAVNAHNRRRKTRSRR